MGGQNAGEVASSIAVGTIRTFIERTCDTDAVTWPFGIDPRLSPGANRVVTAVKLANRRVFESGEDIERRGMGTTVVAALIEDRAADLHRCGRQPHLFLLPRGAPPAHRRRFMDLGAPREPTGSRSGRLAPPSDAQRPDQRRGTQRGARAESQ